MPKAAAIVPEAGSGGQILCSNRRFLRIALQPKSASTMSNAPKTNELIARTRQSGIE